MTTTPNGARILYCHCAYSEITPREVKTEVLTGLASSGAAFEAVADLCALAARRDPALKRLAAGDGRLDVVACFPRTVKWLFAAAEAPLPDHGVTVHNLRTESAAAILAGLPGERSPAVAPAAGSDEIERLEAEAARPGAWTPWFPLIDRDRCENCQQCLSFCLFGVFDIDEDDRIRVKNPEKCKTNCPACARVCPEVAIIFPKYHGGPINGDEVRAADIEREKVQTDVSAVLGGDVYSLLRNRQQQAAARFSKDRDEALALRERQCCVKKLQETLDIPDEVLYQLPTAKEVRDRAARRIAAREDRDRTTPVPDRT